MNNTAFKRALDIASKVFSWIIVLVTVIMVVFTIFSTATFDKHDRAIFGTKFYVVLSDSMSLSENNRDDKVHFDAGDIVIIKEVDDIKSLKEGDIISFISQNDESFGETVTHKIREIRYDLEGKLLGYVTYGTNTGVDDKVLVTPGYVLGTYSGKIPNLGHFFQFLKTTPGYITCILVPFLLLIIWQGVKTVRLFLKYKEEQNAAIKAERAELAEQKIRNEAMMAELVALKQMLEQKDVTKSSDSSAPNSDSDSDKTN